MVADQLSGCINQSGPCILPCWVISQGLFNFIGANKCQKSRQTAERPSVSGAQAAVDLNADNRLSDTF
jgi:hypothetical protein